MLLQKVSRKLRHTVVSMRDLTLSTAPFIILAAALLLTAYWWLEPNPPRTVRLATGPAQSAYDEFGKHYAKILAKDGIKVVLVPSEGSSSNLQLLREGKVDLGFVQGGSADSDWLRDMDNDSRDKADEIKLVSLSSLFLEPIWLFYRQDSIKNRCFKLTNQSNQTIHDKNNSKTLIHQSKEAKDQTFACDSSRIDALSDLLGLKLNVGTAGSGVPTLMQQLFEANHIDSTQINLSHLDQTAATVAFLNGEIDALVFVSAPESMMVQMLLQSPGIHLMNFAQNNAYSRRFAFLSAVTLPQGVVDLSKNIPSDDVNLVASTTTLLSAQGTHSALLQLFSLAAIQIHSKPSWFNRAREYPNIEHTQFPIAKEAERALHSGTPLLQRYLNFWIANLVERMWLAFGIIFAVLWPLTRIIPPLYTFRIRSRIFKWYGQLRDIEEQVQQAPHSAGNFIPVLNEIDQKINDINIPLAFADELYALKSNINLVRKKLQFIHKSSALHLNNPHPPSA